MIVSMSCVVQLIVMIAMTLELEKSKQSCEILSKIDIDMWLVWVRETSQTLDPVLPLIAGIDLVWNSALIYTKSGERIAIVGNFDADAVESKGVFQRVVPYTKDIRPVLLEEIQRINPISIAINYSKNNVAADGLTHGMFMILREMLDGTPYLKRLTSAETLIEHLRGRKTEEEVRRIQKAIDITEEIYKKAQSFVRVGMTEIEIADQFHRLMTELGVGPAWNIDHNPAVDAGPNKQFGHGLPSDNKVKAGHLVHFDFGVRWNGYCSDIQRMLFMGAKSDIPDEVSAAFETVRDAIQKASEFIRPGVRGFEVDAIARDYVKDHGYEEYQHALGHQLGRHAHDGGTLLGPLWERYSDSPKGKVESGNVFTLELYVTTKNYGQVSLEEDVLVTSAGCKFLSRPQRELICIVN